MIKTEPALAIIEVTHSKMPINHIDRVVSICDLLLEVLTSCSEIYKSAFPEPEDRVLFLESVQYHDIGKALIDQVVINKSTAISHQDYEIMKTHVESGLSFVENAIETGNITGDRRIQYIRECILFHHEKWDGSGYPKGKKNHDIPCSARILAIADTYDSALSPRPWKEPLSCEQIYDYIVSESGHSFDPVAVVAFQRTHDVIKSLYN